MIISNKVEFMGVVQLNLDKFYKGDVYDAYEYFGAHLEKDSTRNVNGTRFKVFAPNAKNVELIGEFSNWEGLQMEKGPEWGMYSLFVKDAKEGMMYKYRVYGNDGSIVDKTDPYGFFTELRPNTASIIVDIDKFKFNDKNWMENRDKDYKKPVNIYEMHFGSWKHKVPDNEEAKDEDRWYGYREICHDLIKYVKDNGYTHIEFLPLCEYPFDGSWGYQGTGYFSVTSRYGTPEDFMYLVNECHKNNIGVILDFVPVHFAIDETGLAKFDGTELYEYNNDAMSHSEWGSCNFNFYRAEVQTFILSSANFWLEKYHIDGIRMDAIGNIIYWQGDQNRGVNNGACDFVRKINGTLSKLHKGVMLIAEDSTSFPKVTAPVEYGGLGFTYKWDMGWMNDTLRFFSMSPEERKDNLKLLTFSMFYFYNENYLLPFSHDEVVHGKKTIIDKMYGSYEEKFSECKCLYTYMFTHPGKKLNFMGNEIAHFREWDERRELDWNLLKYPMHESFSRFFRDLNKIYASFEALYENEYDSRFYRGIETSMKDNLIYAYERKSQKENIITILNLGNEKIDNLTVGYDKEIKFVEVINSDSKTYSGSGIVNEGTIKSIKKSIGDNEYSFNISIAPYSGVILKTIK